jgi:hypothetical protein
MTHGVAPCQTCGDHDESPDPISGFRWHVDAHRVEPEPGQAEPAVVISGRASKDLRRRVGLQEMCYGGHRRAAWRGR